MSDKRNVRPERFAWKPDEATIVKQEDAPPPPENYADAWADAPPPGQPAPVKPPSSDE